MPLKCKSCTNKRRNDAPVLKQRKFPTKISKRCQPAVRLMHRCLHHLTVVQLDQGDTAKSKQVAELDAQKLIDMERHATVRVDEEKKMATKRMS